MPSMPVAPMLCKLESPAWLETIDPIGWIAEPKYDGVRIIAGRSGDRVRLWTRGEHDVAPRYPEVVASLKIALPAGRWVVDGELTIAGGFEALLKRNTGDRLKISILSKKMPATYRVFDVIEVGEESVRTMPLSERKKALDGLLKPSGQAQPVPYETPSDLRAAFDRYVARGWEGIVVKRVDAPYVPGHGDAWVKVKRGDTLDVLIVGVTRSDALPFGALVMARGGRYFGKVGSGFTVEERRALLDWLKKRAVRESQIEVPAEVRAGLLFACTPVPAEVRISEQTRDGAPRAPVWGRLRWDEF